MSSAKETLLRAAAAFEKAAEYFDQAEVAAREKSAATLKSDLLDPINEALELRDPKLREKLAATDPEVLKLIKSSVANQRMSDDLSLGASTEKTAGYSDDALLAFCSSDD